MRYSAGGIVSGSGDDPVRIGHRGWQRPHHGIAVAVAIGYRCSGSIRDRGQAVAAAAIGRSGLNGLPAGTGQGGSCHIAGAVVAHCLSDLPIGDGLQPVGIGSVVGVGEGAVAAGNGLDQVSTGIGILVLVKTRRGDRDQLSVGVILHGLSHFPQQGNVVEVAIVGIAFISQRDPNLLHGFSGLFGNNADTGELPLIADIRIEGDVMSFCSAVRIGNSGTQTALLGNIVRIVQFTGIIRNCVGSRPARKDIGLGTGQIQSDVLISVGAGAQRIAGDFQGSG